MRRDTDRLETVKAHRVAWELAYDPIPNGLLVCHTCDNLACVRPDHLFLGTQHDNMKDAYDKGRLFPVGAWLAKHPEKRRRIDD